MLFVLLYIYIHECSVIHLLRIYSFCTSQDVSVCRSAVSIFLIIYYVGRGVMCISADDKQELEIVCKIENHKTDNEQNEHRNYELIFTVFINQFSNKNYTCNKHNKAHNSNNDQSRCNFKLVTAEKSVGAVLKIDNQVWEENLHRN